MKRFIEQRRFILSLIWMLVILSILTTPLALTQARYTSNGTAAASARVAKFDTLWRPVTGNNSNTVTDSVGSLDSGYIIHPGNWQSKTIDVYWRVTNNSEVAIRSRVEPRLYSGSWVENGYEGEYYPSDDVGWHSLNNSYLQWLSSGSVSPENTTAIQSVAIGASKWFTFTIKPNTNSSALAVANRPSGSRNTGDFNTAISQSRPIVFDTGGGSSRKVHTSMEDMNSTWWRTIRVNAAGVDEQVD